MWCDDMQCRRRCRVSSLFIYIFIYFSLSTGEYGIRDSVRRTFDATHTQSHSNGQRMRWKRWQHVYSRTDKFSKSYFWIREEDDFELFSSKKMCAHGRFAESVLPSRAHMWLHESYSILKYFFSCSSTSFRKYFSILTEHCTRCRRSTLWRMDGKKNHCRNWQTEIFTTQLFDSSNARVSSHVSLGFHKRTMNALMATDLLNSQLHFYIRNSRSHFDLCPGACRWTLLACPGAFHRRTRPKDKTYLINLFVYYETTAVHLSEREKALKGGTKTPNEILWARRKEQNSPRKTMTSRDSRRKMKMHCIKTDKVTKFMRKIRKNSAVYQ